VRYERLGEVPQKRHTVLRENGTLLTEEVMGYEGFSGNESILYHLQSPCRVMEVGDFTPIEREEWVPDAHVHHLVDTRGLEPCGDPISGRRLLMWNDDVEIAICRPAEQQSYFFRSGDGDEVIFVHEGRGQVETSFGTLPYEAHDYVVIPRGTVYRFAPDSGDTLLLTFHTPGEIETPNRYRNRYGQLLEHAPFSHRDFKTPVRLETHRDRGEHDLVVRVRDGYQRYKLDYHPLDVVAWDGYVYPYTFSIDDFEPITGRVHMPPPVHQTFQGPNFVICSFCPRKLDWHEDAVPIPYNHSNLQSEEMIYYVDGNFGSRKGVDVGTITLHPSGLPHGPQPGLAEKSLGTTETDELAVMCDTFKPLRLTQLARELDDGKYVLSWYEGAEADGSARSNGAGSPAGVTSHL
jgi:homogentisate 1,2-dioxygenase